MKVIVLSENLHQIRLLRGVLEQHEIEVIDVKNRNEISELLGIGDLLAVILDFPNPKEEDFNYWRELLRKTVKPVILLSSDIKDPSRILSRQIAT